jgi:hypothetical protein
LDFDEAAADESLMLYLPVAALLDRCHSERSEESPQFESRSTAGFFAPLRTTDPLTPTLKGER